MVVPTFLEPIAYFLIMSLLLVMVLLIELIDSLGELYIPVGGFFGEIFEEKGWTLS